MINRFLHNLTTIENQLSLLSVSDIDNAKELKANLFALVKVTSKFDEYLPQILDVTFKPTDFMYNTGHHKYKEHFDAAKESLVKVIVSIKREVGFGALDLIPLSKPETVSIPWIWNNMSARNLLWLLGLLVTSHFLAFGIGKFFS